MTKHIGLAFALALPTTALANEPYFQIDLGASQDFRGGDDLNSSGTGSELSEFSLAKVDGLAAYTLDNGLLLQGGLTFDHNFAETILPGGGATDDTYRQGRQASLQFGSHLEDSYFGAYATVGRVDFNPSDTDQNANFHALGVQTGWYGESWQVSGLLGYLNSKPDNPETIDNAVVLGATASFDLTSETRLNGSMTFMNGEQDTDSGSGPDAVRVLAVGAEIEHTLRQTGYGSLAVYSGLSLINVWEDSSSGSTDHVNDKIITAGVRMHFGASGASASDRRSSPPLPEMLRILGAVPAVD